MSTSRSENPGSKPGFFPAQDMINDVGYTKYKKNCNEFKILPSSEEMVVVHFDPAGSSSMDASHFHDQCRATNGSPNMVPANTGFPLCG